LQAFIEQFDSCIGQDVAAIGEVIDKTAARKGPYMNTAGVHGMFDIAIDIKKKPRNCGVSILF